MSVTMQSPPVQYDLCKMYPEFAQFGNVPPPPAYEGNISPELWGILEHSTNLSVRQHLKLFPKACCVCPPCAPQESTFSIYAGLTRDSQREILRIDEVSDDWNRCCCKPYHPFRMEMRQFFPLPGQYESSDWSHLGSDFLQDWNRAGATEAERQVMARDLYLRQPALASLIRDDGQHCSLNWCCNPCAKWLTVCVCGACCQDGTYTYQTP